MITDGVCRCVCGYEAWAVLSIETNCYRVVCCDDNKFQCWQGPELSDKYHAIAHWNVIMEQYRDE